MVSQLFLCIGGYNGLVIRQGGVTTVLIHRWFGSETGCFSDYQYPFLQFFILSSLKYLTDDVCWKINSVNQHLHHLHCPGHQGVAMLSAVFVRLAIRSAIS